MSFLNIVVVVVVVVVVIVIWEMLAFEQQNK